MEQESQPKQAPTAEELKAQAASDEQTVFVLAALMVDVYAVMMTADIKELQANRQKLKALVSQVGMLLNSNAGFIDRFKAAQQQMLKDAGMEVKPKPQIITPHSGIVMP